MNDDVSVIPSPATWPTASADLAGLSSRELDVLRLVTRGYSNAEITGELYITINTVKTVIRNAYRKIGATRRSQAVAWGFQHGLFQDAETAA